MVGWWRIYLALRGQESLISMWLAGGFVAMRFVNARSKSTMPRTKPLLLRANYWPSKFAVLSVREEISHCVNDL